MYYIIRLKKTQNNKNEPTLNIVESKKCRNCGQQFKKRHRTSCPARDRKCNTCGLKGHFAKHEQPSTTRSQTDIVDQNPTLTEQETHMTNPSENPEFKLTWKTS